MRKAQRKLNSKVRLTSTFRKGDIVEDVKTKLQYTFVEVREAHVRLLEENDWSYFVPLDEFNQTFVNITYLTENAASATPG